MSIDWKKIRYRVEWLAIRGMAHLIPRLPRRMSHVLADLLGTTAYYVHWPGRKVALSNLAAAFPDMPPAQRKRTAVESYRHFARAQADLFWSARLTAANLH